MISGVCDCNEIFGLGIQMPFSPALKFSPLVAWQDCWQHGIWVRSSSAAGLMCTVQVGFPFRLVFLFGWSCGWTAGQAVSASWQNTYCKMGCCAPSKACSLQIENEGMSSHHKDSNFSRIRGFFFPLYRNAGMINNQHISVAAFVLYSLNLLGCHLFILSLRRNKSRNRGCSNPRTSEEMKLACDWMYAVCIILYASCMKIFPLNTREVFILSLNK